MLDSVRICHFSIPSTSPLSIQSLQIKVSPIQYPITSSSLILPIQSPHSFWPRLWCRFCLLSLDQFKIVSKIIKDFFHGPWFRVTIIFQTPRQRRMVNTDRFGYASKGILFFLNDSFQYFWNLAHGVYISPFNHFVNLFLCLSPLEDFFRDCRKTLQYS